jgi:hypothetical protein
MCVLLQWKLVPFRAPNASVSNVTTTTARVVVIPGTTSCQVTSYMVNLSVAGEAKNVNIPRPKISISRSRATIDIIGLAPGKTYNVAIMGVCSSGEKKHISPLKFTTAAATPEYVPTVILLNATKTSVAIMIEPPKSGCLPVSYYVRRSSGGEKTVIVTVKASKPSHQLDGLTSGRTYEVTAVGVCADGLKTSKSYGLFVKTVVDVPPVEVTFTIRTSASAADIFDDKVKVGICEELLANIDYPKGDSQEPLLCDPYSY